MKYFLPLASLLLALPLTAQNYRDVAELDSGMNSPYSTSVIATEGEHTVVVWQEDTTKELWSVTSVSQGTSFNDKVRIDNDSTSAKKYLDDIHNLAVWQSNIYMVWRDERNGADDVYFTTSTDGGFTFSGDTLLDKGGPNSCYDVEMVNWEDNLYVLSMTDDGDEGVWFTSSNDGGATWTTAMRLDPALGDVDSISMTNDEDTIYVAYNDDRNATYNEDIFVRVSTDGGLTWSADTQVNTDGDAVYPVIRCGNDAAVVTWLADKTATSSSDEETWAAFTTDTGATWGANSMVSTGADADNMSMSWVGDSIGGICNIAWEDNRNGSDEVFVASSDDFGGSWHEASFGAGAYPVIESDINYVGVAFNGGSYPETAAMSVSSDGGLTRWSPIADLGNGTGGDTDYMALCYDEIYESFNVSWNNDNTGANRVYAGGCRAQTLTMNGTFQAGQTIDFSVSDFGINNTGMQFRVAGSFTDANPILLSDGLRLLYIDNDIAFQTTKNMPELRGTIDGSGNGATSSVTVPSVVTPGMDMYWIAVTIDFGANVASITDPLHVTAS